jgi:hypothetical protein
MRSYPPRVQLEIYLAGGDTEELINEFAKFVRKMKKHPYIKSCDIRRKRNSFPVGRIRDELNRYLKVYDLRKTGMKYKHIIKKIGTKAQRDLSDDPDIQRQFIRDFKNAKKIIKNVEKGYFPM